MKTPQGSVVVVRIPSLLRHYVSKYKAIIAYSSYVSLRVPLAIYSEFLNGIGSRVTSGSSGFSALMPPQPTTSIVTNQTGVGPLVISIVSSEPSRVVAFSILHNNFPTNLPLTDTERLFSGGLKQALNRWASHFRTRHIPQRQSG